MLKPSQQKVCFDFRLLFQDLSWVWHMHIWRTRATKRGSARCSSKDRYSGTKLSSPCCKCVSAASRHAVPQGLVSLPTLQAVPRDSFEQAGGPDVIPRLSPRLVLSSPLGLTPQSCPGGVLSCPPCTRLAHQCRFCWTSPHAVDSFPVSTTRSPAFSTHPFFW